MEFLEKKTPIESKLIGIINPLLQNLGYELIDIQYIKEGRRTLRIFIDKEGGVNLNDCEKINYLIGDVLDAHDIISDSYNLEVSSPGINRPLTKREHFKRFLGQKSIIQLREPYQNRKKFKGVLAELNESDDYITLQDENNNKINIPFTLITKARLDLI